MTAELVSPAQDIEWTALAAGVLGIPADEVRRHAPTAPFLRLGGTSLRATEFAGLVERRLGRTVDMAALLGPDPLAEVVAASTPAIPRVVLPPVGGAALRPVGVVQESMVLSEQLQASAQFHLLFSAEISGPLDEVRWCAAIDVVTRRHEGLRTVFVLDRGELRMRVLDTWRPRILRPRLPPGGVVDVLETVHSLLRAAGLTLLRPLEQPPVVFALTRVDGTRAVASLLIHHAISDGWSIGELWSDILTAYDGDEFAAPAASSDIIAAVEQTEAAAVQAETRRTALAGAPLSVEISGDLRRPDVFDRRGVRLAFGLSDAARTSCEQVAGAAGVTRNAVLLAAWSLAVARRTGQADLLIGMAAAGRTSADLHHVFGLCTKIVPVRSRIEREDTVRDYLMRLALDMRGAMSAGDVPLEILAGALRPPRDLSRTSVIQVGFAAHDEVMPAGLSGRDLTLTIHESHCGGTVFDALLYVQRWTPEVRLCLEYASSVLTPAEAMVLAGQVDAALVEMATDLEAPLAAVRTVGPAARDRLVRTGTGPAIDAETGIWQLFESACERAPDAVALRDGPSGRPLTYTALRDAAARQAAALYEAGVRLGDHVAIGVPRGAAEIVGVLASLRLGAAFVGLDPAAPPSALAQIIGIAAPRAVLAAEQRAAELDAIAPGLTVVTLVDPFAADAPVPTDPPAQADPDRIAYVAFTSGSTGVPKGVRVPHRGVIRLVRDPDILLPGVTDHFLRLATLAFDAAILEIFSTLAAGGCLEIYPTPHLTPDDLAHFLHERGVTGAWLTAGLFRLVGRDRPEAFAGLRQLLAGGDVVPSVESRLVLDACPGLRLTNGYGPTENSTFTTVSHFDDPAALTESLPIGHPIAGTDVMVLDDDGRLLPWGAVGELCTSGAGLAVDYIDAPAETTRSFLTPSDGPRYYRTGDLVRWNGDGDLMILGRRDQQVKIRGFRVEMPAVEALLREHELVQDAVVFVTGMPGDRQLVAGIVASDPAALGRLRAFAAGRLPAYAVPVWWAVVPKFPLNRSGKVDMGQLVELARANVGDPV